MVAYRVNPSRACQARCNRKFWVRIRSATTPMVSHEVETLNPRAAIDPEVRLPEGGDGIDTRGARR